MYRRGRGACLNLILTHSRYTTYRLEKLVNSLLDFSKIEAGRSKGVFERVDLAARTAEVASMFRSAFQKARLDFGIDSVCWVRVRMLKN